MSNYTKTTNFTAKDNLPSGNAAKKVVGSEFDTEFNNIATAITTKADTTALATKADITGAAFTGDISTSSTLNPTVTIKNTDTTIVSGQSIGTIEFRGADDNGNILAGHIQQVTSGDWGSGAYGSDMAFSIKRGGTGGAFLEKLRLTYDGVKITSLLNIVPSAEPSSGVAGDVYYDSTSNKLRCHNGTAWNDLF